MGRLLNWSMNVLSTLHSLEAAGFEFRLQIAHEIFSFSLQDSRFIRGKFVVVVLGSHHAHTPL